MNFLDKFKLKTMSKTNMGYFYIIVAAILIGAIHSFSKPLLSFTPGITELNPLTYSVIVYLLNGLLFTPIKKYQTPIKKIGKRNFALISIIGGLEVSGFVAYFMGLKETTAVNASILFNSEIIFAIVISLLFFKEKLSKKSCFHFQL
jgi:drug/metabolite transporter (DMT)-like permease